MYNRWTDPIEHVSYLNQRMTVHSKNEDLMGKVFPSSLGPMVMRWFDGLGGSSINFFKELTRADLALLLVAEFLNLWTLCCPWPCERGRPWKHLLTSTGRCSTRVNHNLSLTRKLARSVRQPMDRIDEHKQVEEDQQQGKGKEKAMVIIKDRRDFKLDRYNNNWSWRDFAGQSGSIAT